MATADTKLMTADEFRLLSNSADGSQQELVRGEVVIMPPPGIIHGACCGNISRILGNHVIDLKPGRVLANHAGCITESNPDTVRGIDVAYFSFSRLPKLHEGYSKVPPEIAIEVLSPSNESDEIQEKIQEYLAFGVNVVWVVDPLQKSVTVYRSPEEGRVLHKTATLTCEDVLPGFSVLVGDLFVGS